ncbi:MAG: integrase core domain-containing protein [Actinomycetota bacterium]
MENPFIERFNGRLRDEHLNTELFCSVADAQAKVLEWQRDHNEVRPHSSLGPSPPQEFVAAWTTRIRKRGALRVKTNSCRRIISSNWDHPHDRAARCVLQNRWSRRPRNERVRATRPGLQAVLLETPR